MRANRAGNRLILAAVAGALLWLGAQAAEAPVYALPESVSAHAFRFERKTLGGGVVFAEAGLDPQGQPRGLQVLYGDSPFREVAASVLRGWTFTLPTDASEEARLAAVVLFRQPRLLRLGEGEYTVPPVSSRGPNTPPQPERLVEPNHPPRAVSGGVAVLGVALDNTGAVTRLTSLYGSSAFVGAARAAVRQWRFVPARQGGQPVASGLVVVVYFPRPTLAGTPRD